MKRAENTPVEDFLEKQLKGRDFGKLLDVGCGDGSFLDDLLSVGSATAVYGIDIDDDALSEAKSYFMKAGPDIPYYFFNAASSKPNIPDAPFDSISFQDMMHHLSGGNFSHTPDTELSIALIKHLEALNGILAPGGMMIASEIIVDDDLPDPRKNRILLHNIKAEVDSFHGIPHSYSWNAESLADALETTLSPLGYTCKFSTVCETQNNPVMAGREDRALEQAFEYFTGYIATLKPLATKGSVPSTTIQEMTRRLEAVRRSADESGLLNQRRYLSIWQKDGGGNT